MKSKIFFLSIVILFSTLGCKKAGKELACKCVQVKLIKDICNQSILQIVDSKYYDLGENNFTIDGVSYDHVFYADLNCVDYANMPQTLTSDRIGLTFNIEILSEKVKEENCVTCMALLSNRPSKSYFVKVSKTCLPN